MFQYKAAKFSVTPRPVLRLLGVTPHVSHRAPLHTTLWFCLEKQILLRQAYSVMVCSLTHWGQAQHLLSPSYETGYPWITFNIWFCIYFNHTSCDKWIYAIAFLWKIGTTAEQMQCNGDHYTECGRQIRWRDIYTLKWSNQRSPKLQMLL